MIGWFGEMEEMGWDMEKIERRGKERKGREGCNGVFLPFLMWQLPSVLLGR
jgi:hypothetical protein